MSEILAQIETPPGRRAFSVGIVLIDDVVSEASGVVKYMRGWTRDRVRAYCRARGWSVIVVTKDGRLNPFLEHFRQSEAARQRIATAGGKGAAAYLAQDRDDERLAEIAAIPDEAIDTSDIPEATEVDFKRAKLRR
jgi:hypothetical protein